MSLNYSKGNQTGFCMGCVLFFWFVWLFTSDSFYVHFIRLDLEFQMTFVLCINCLAAYPTHLQETRSARIPINSPISIFMWSTFSFNDDSNNFDIFRSPDEKRIIWKIIPGMVFHQKHPILKPLFFKYNWNKNRDEIKTREYFKFILVPFYDKIFSLSWMQENYIEKSSMRAYNHRIFSHKHDIC